MVIDRRRRIVMNESQKCYFEQVTATNESLRLSSPPDWEWLTKEMDGANVV